MSKLLDEADKLQLKTKNLLYKINSDINQIDNIADSTLEELRANSEQIDETINETNSIDKKLDKSEQLKNTFSMLNGRFFDFNLGFSKNKKSNKTKSTPSNKPSTNVNVNNGSNRNSNNNFTNFAEIQVGSDNLANRLSKINKTDNEIDNTLDAIGNSLDKIMEKAYLMKDQVIQQNHKLDDLNSNMSNVVNKQNKISANLKNILRWKS